MSRVFADTHFYLAILNERDSEHARAHAVSAEHDFGEIVTTAGVLLELADGMAKARYRERCARFLRYLRAAEATKIVPLTDALIERGLALYSSRLDKEWSLTDCISFVVMRDEGLTDALTGDRHFEQAGFVALLA